MGQVIKKEFFNCNSLVGIYSPGFTFSDPDAQALDVYTVVTYIEYSTGINRIYTFTGNFLWSTTASNITGNVTILLNLSPGRIFSGIVQTDKDMTSANHWAYWDGSPNDFNITSTMNNHTDAIYSFTFIFS